MNPNNVLGELIEKGQNTASAAVSDVADSVSNQVGLKNETASQVSQAQSQSQSQDQAQQQGESAQIQTERTKEMVADFYSPSEDYTQTGATQAQTDEQRLSAVRQKLHQELHNEVYFNEILNADATKPNEERPGEKAERQQMEELQLKQEKQQNELPLAVQRAQTHIEVSPGIAG